MDRRATLQDVANAVLRLASDQASFLSGVRLDIAGRRRIQSPRERDSPYGPPTRPGAYVGVKQQRQSRTRHHVVD
jgi:hypothetical protein